MEAEKVAKLVLSISILVLGLAFLLKATGWGTGNTVKVNNVEVVLGQSGYLLHASLYSETNDLVEGVYVGGDYLRMGISVHRGNNTFWIPLGNRAPQSVTLVLSKYGSLTVKPSLPSYATNLAPVYGNQYLYLEGVLAKKAEAIVVSPISTSNRVYIVTTDSITPPISLGSLNATVEVLTPEKAIDKAPFDGVVIYLDLVPDKDFIELLGGIPVIDIYSRYPAPRVHYSSEKGVSVEPGDPFELLNGYCFTRKVVGRIVIDGEESLWEAVKAFTDAVVPAYSIVPAEECVQSIYRKIVVDEAGNILLAVATIGGVQAYISTMDPAATAFIVATGLGAADVSIEKLKLQPFYGVKPLVEAPGDEALLVLRAGKNSWIMYVAKRVGDYKYTSGGAATSSLAISFSRCRGRHVASVYFVRGGPLPPEIVEKDIETVYCPGGITVNPPDRPWDYAIVYLDDRPAVVIAPEKFLYNRPVVYVDINKYYESFHAFVKIYTSHGMTHAPGIYVYADGDVERIPLQEGPEKTLRLSRHLGPYRVIVYGPFGETITERYEKIVHIYESPFFVLVAVVTVFLPVAGIRVTRLRGEVELEKVRVVFDTPAEETAIKGVSVALVKSSISSLQDSIKSAPTVTEVFEMLEKKGVVGDEMNDVLKTISALVNRREIGIAWNYFPELDDYVTVLSVPSPGNWGIGKELLYRATAKVLSRLGCIVETSKAFEHEVKAEIGVTRGNALVLGFLVPTGKDVYNALNDMLKTLYEFSEAKLGVDFRGVFMLVPPGYARRLNTVIDRILKGDRNAIAQYLKEADIGLKLSTRNIDQWLSEYLVAAVPYTRVALIAATLRDRKAIRFVNSYYRLAVE